MNSGYYCIIIIDSRLASQIRDTRVENGAEKLCLKHIHCHPSKRADRNPVYRSGKVGCTIAGAMNLMEGHGHSAAPPL